MSRAGGDEPPARRMEEIMKSNDLLRMLDLISK